MLHVGRTFARVRSWIIEAFHRRRADVVFALVNVLAAQWCLNVPVLTLALAVEALLSLFAVRVETAAGIAKFILANFALQTILVRMTNLQAHAFQALLSTCALCMIDATGHAVALVALLSLRTIDGASLRDSDASLLSCRNSCEAFGTAANIGAGGASDALGIRAAGHGACVLASLVDALKWGGAVQVGRAATDANASFAGLTAAALIVVDANGLTLAFRTNSTVGVSDAFHFRSGRGNKRWRTLANVFVIIGQTESIFSAGISFAGVHAGVRKSIAILFWRAVIVFQTFDFLAA